MLFFVKVLGQRNGLNLMMNMCRQRAQPGRVLACAELNFTQQKKLFSTSKDLEQLTEFPPKRPLTSYLLFCNDERPKSSSTESMISQTKALAEKWNALSLDKKEKYTKEAAVLKDKYNADLSAYFEKYPQYMKPQKPTVVRPAQVLQRSHPDKEYMELPRVEKLKYTNDALKETATLKDNYRKALDRHNAFKAKMKEFYKSQKK